MKGFAKIALSVALIAVIVLSIVVASVAWFTSNPDVNANNVAVNAPSTLTVIFDANDADTGYRYNGQIGNVAPPDEDAPYVYEAGGFTIDLTSLSTDDGHGKVKVEFGTVSIETQVEGMGTISGVLITDLFHITADIFVLDEYGLYVRENATSDGTCRIFRLFDDENDDEELPRYSKAFSDLEIADDGVLMETVSNVTQAAQFEKSVYEVSFTYTFLPDAAYAVWESACAETPTAEFEDILGYELAAGGDYIGVLDYVTYKPKYHYGLQRYAKSATADESGNYTYTLSEDGAYVRAISDYKLKEEEPGDGGVKLYRAVVDPETEEITSYSDSGEGDYNYIKVGDSGDYFLFSRYNQINGFPYSADQYRGERFTFTVCCSVEEVTL